MTKLATVFFLSLLCGTTYAQNYVLEYEFPAHQLVDQNPEGIKNYWQRQYDGCRDMNADGVDDLIMIRDGGQDHPVEMVVFDIVTREQIWNWVAEGDISSLFTEPEPRFMGFADIDGDGSLRELLFIFSGDGVPPPEDRLLILDPVTKTPEFERSGVRVAVIADVDGDGQHELIINKTEGGTEVWGAGSAGWPRR